MNYLKQNHLALLIILFLGYSAFTGASQTFGVAANVTTIGNPWVFTNSVKMGLSGTAQTNEVLTTCSMIANNASVGTTTQYAYCTGVTGVVSTDYVVASFATSSTALADQWVITGVSASSTAGVIDFRLLKLTGVAASQAMSAVTTIGSSTVIRAGH